MSERPPLPRPAVPLARWRTLQRRFDQRPARERALMIAAAVAITLAVADALWLGPALTDFQAARGQRDAARQALQRLASDTQQLREQGSAQARARQAELASWRERVRDGDRQLRAQQDLLVGPERMVELLEQLLARQGNLRVRALRSLPRQDLLAAAGQPTPAAAPAATATPARSATAPAAADEAAPTLYRHGVELVLEGGYADLLAYLRALEALPQRVLFGSVGLKVEQHPRTVLTLRVYTLSRERHWLEI